MQLFQPSPLPLSSRRSAPVLAAVILGVLVPAGRAAAGYPEFTGGFATGPGEAPGPHETGSWLSRGGRERVFLTIFNDGGYRAVREQDRTDGRINTQWDLGRFALDGDHLILTREPSGSIDDCREAFQGRFLYKIIGKRLHLRGRQASFTFAPRLDGARAIAPAPPAKAVHGCFRGKLFQPNFRGYPALLTGRSTPSGLATQLPPPADPNPATNRDVRDYH